MSNPLIRVLIAKPGLDGHDRGAKVVARGLRDAGFEVIYTGLHQTPEMVVGASIQEDVDIIGLSILSGAHLPLVEAILKLMKSRGLKKPVFVGGIIPEVDGQALYKMGVAAVFGPGTSLDTIAQEVRACAMKASTAHSVVSSKSGKKSAAKAGVSEKGISKKKTIRRPAQKKKTKKSKK
ncbi:MAG: cobalamin B12-binding domain-containing protein [Bdellovibrionales bacterium]|nr:cobalamin B12-binding domain-containing protein [Bdellovibrionales bacterium]